MRRRPGRARACAWLTSWTCMRAQSAKMSALCIIGFGREAHGCRARFGFSGGLSLGSLSRLSWSVPLFYPMGTSCVVSRRRPSARVQNPRAMSRLADPGKGRRRAKWVCSRGCATVVWTLWRRAGKRRLWTCVGFVSVIIIIQATALCGALIVWSPDVHGHGVVPPPRALRPARRAHARLRTARASRLPETTWDVPSE